MADTPESPELINVNWNQDHGCFACGLSSGFRIYNSDPLKETKRRGFIFDFVVFQYTTF